jgi:hypothetical protein
MNLRSASLCALFVLSSLFTASLSSFTGHSIGVCPEEITEGVYSFHLSIPEDEDVSSCKITMKLEFSDSVETWIGIDWNQNGIIDSVWKPMLGSQSGKQITFLLHNENGDWNGWQQSYLDNSEIKGLILTPHSLLGITVNFEPCTEEIETLDDISILADTEGKSDPGPVDPIPTSKPVPSMMPLISPEVPQTNPLAVFAAAVFAASVCCLCLACCKDKRHTTDVETQTNDIEPKPLLSAVNVEAPPLPNQEDSSLPAHPIPVYYSYSYMPPTAPSYSADPSAPQPVYPWAHTYQYPTYWPNPQPHTKDTH